MATISLQIQPWLEVRAIGTGKEARRDVLIVCPDGSVLQEYVRVFEKRNLSSGQALDCRAGIAAQLVSGVRLAVIVAVREDPYMGALVHSLWTRQPRPSIWLIGNPSILRLTEIVARHEVAVMPESTTPEQFEHTLFALDVAKPNHNGSNGKRMLVPRLPRQEKYVEDFHRAKWEFERRFLMRALQCYHGNLCRTAKAIGIHRRSLQEKVRSLEIDIQSTRA